jgi:hypothetical protein
VLLVGVVGFAVIGLALVVLVMRSLLAHAVGFKDELGAVI